MTASLIDGNALSALLRQQVGDRVKALHSRGITAGLAVLLVGDNPASQVYVRNKVKACEQTGIHSLLEKHEATLSEADLLARVHALNQDDSIHMRSSISRMPKIARTAAEMNVRVRR